MEPPFQPFRTVCPYCGVGCGMVLHVAGERVVRVSGDKAHPANFGSLCTKGSTVEQTLRSADRLRFAQRRRPAGAEAGAGAASGAGGGQGFERVPLDVALQTVADRLRAIIAAHGPDAVALYVSGQLSTEAQYVANKLCKGFLRTNNIDSNSRLCMASAASGYKLSLGADGPPGHYEDFESADLFFVIGSNMAECHPILHQRMRRRMRDGKARLIVADPRRTATAAGATLYLPLKPGSDLALLNGLLHLLVEAGRVDHDFIARYTEGWEDVRAIIGDYSPDLVAEVTGVPEADMRAAARLLAESPRWMSLWTMGLNQSARGTWQVNALCNLHLATGQICRRGRRAFLIDGSAERDGRPRGRLHERRPARASLRAFRAGPGRDGGALGRPRRDDPRGGWTAGGRPFQGAGARGRESVVDHREQPGGDHPQPRPRAPRAGARGIRGRAGCVSSHGNVASRARALTRRGMGRSGGNHDQFQPHGDLHAARGRSARRGDAGLVAHLGSCAVHGLRRGVSVHECGADFRRIANGRKPARGLRPAAA